MSRAAAAISSGPLIKPEGVLISVMWRGGFCAIKNYQSVLRKSVCDGCYWLQLRAELRVASTTKSVCGREINTNCWKKFGFVIFACDRAVKSFITKLSSAVRMKGFILSMF